MRLPNGARARRTLAPPRGGAVPHRQVSGSPRHPARGRTPDDRAGVIACWRSPHGPGLPGDDSLSVAADRRGAPDPGPVARANEGAAPDEQRIRERLPARGGGADRRPAIGTRPREIADDKEHEPAAAALLPLDPRRSCPTPPRRSVCAPAALSFPSSADPRRKKETDHVAERLLPALEGPAGPAATGAATPPAPHPGAARGPD